MAWRILNTVLLAALAGIALLKAFGPGEIAVRNFEMFPDMARAYRYNSFAPNPNFKDGATLQAPVPGTVRVEPFPLMSSRSQETDLVPAGGKSMENPFPSTDAAAVARGQVVYSSFCQPCHGESGAGDGTITKRGYPEPPSLTAGGAVDMDDATLFRTVSQGGLEMPAYASQIAPADRWRVITYLRTLQSRGAAPAAATAP